MGPHQHVPRLRGFLKRIFLPPVPRSVDRLQTRRNNYRTKSIVFNHALPPPNIYAGDRVMIRTGRHMGRIGMVVQDDTDGTRTMIVQFCDSISRSNDLEARVPRMLPRPGADLSGLFLDGKIPPTFPKFLDGVGYDSDYTVQKTNKAEADMTHEPDCTSRDPRVAALRVALTPTEDNIVKIEYMSKNNVSKTVSELESQEINLDIDIPWGILSRASSPAGSMRKKYHILPYENVKQSRRLGWVSDVFSAETAALQSDVTSCQRELTQSSLLKFDEGNLVLVEECTTPETTWSFDGYMPCEVETRREVVDRRTGRALRFRFSRRTNAEIPLPSSVFDRPEDPTRVKKIQPELLKRMAQTGSEASVSHACSYTTPSKAFEPHYLTEELVMRADMYLPVGFRMPMVNLHRLAPMLRNHATYYKLNNFYDPMDRERGSFKIFEW